MLPSAHAKQNTTTITTTTTTTKHIFMKEKWNYNLDYVILQLALKVVDLKLKTYSSRNESNLPILRKRYVQPISQKEKECYHLQQYIYL